jgi:hypothetical protein
MLASFVWTDLALSSRAAFLAIQFAFLLVLSAFHIRRLIDTRIGGLEAVEIRSWPRLVSGMAVCNGAYLLMHHLYLVYGPYKSSRILFAVLHFVTAAIFSIVIISTLGIVFDLGKAIRVRTGRFKPQHSRYLIDMTREEGRNAQLIPRGAIFAYQPLMIASWFALYASQPS